MSAYNYVHFSIIKPLLSIQLYEKARDLEESSVFRGWNRTVVSILDEMALSLAMTLSDVTLDPQLMQEFTRDLALITYAISVIERSS